MVTRASRPLWIILALAGFIRLAFVLAYPQPAPTNDAAAYDHEGWHMASGGAGCPNPLELAKGPIYPLFLAAVYRAAGHWYPAVRVAQAVIGVVAVWLIFLIAQRLFGPRVALAAGALATIYPPFISYAGWLLTETIGTTLLLAVVYALLRGLDSQDWRPWALAGAASGVLILHREEFLVVIGLCVLTLAALRVAWRRLGLMVLVIGLMMMPWVVRNFRHYGEFVLISPGGGQQLWLSTLGRDALAWQPEDPEYQRVIGSVGFLESDRLARRAAIENVRRDPLRYAQNCLRRIPRLWIGGHSNTFVGLEASVSEFARRGNYGKVAIKLAMLAGNLLVLGLGVVGFFIAWQLGATDRRALVVVAAPVVAKALLHTLLFSTLRYQVPIMGCFIVMAAFAVSHARHVLRDVVPLGAS